MTLCRLWFTPDRCSLPLGMEDRRILSGNLRASSSYNYNHGPDRARLNIYASHGRTGAWVAKYRNTKQWLQIDLGQMCIVKGIATQGRRKGHLEWMKSYVLSYSKDGLRFRAYSVGGRLKVCFKQFIRLCAFYSDFICNWLKTFVLLFWPERRKVKKRPLLLALLAASSSYFGTGLLFFLKFVLDSTTVSK